MSEPWIGQIRQVGFNFAPRGFALCDGQLLPISQNSALFSLLGTAFGGDGRTDFALPDLRGRVATHVGTGPGLSSIQWGAKGGAQTHTLSISEMPSHNHSISALAEAGDSGEPAGRYPAAASEDIYSESHDTTMASAMCQNTGGGQPFWILSPWLGIYHVIALQGIFPSRN